MLTKTQKYPSEANFARVFFYVSTTIIYIERVYLKNKVAKITLKHLLLSYGL